ncbi:hypothetical protein CEXT_370651 [Caerostris extrusa]|uniref:Uncharacterized protein n=1 Tax=Caerostris extrusa TaxID=172846 RepID=A0AAV4PBK9_CAEEX|nr:hypothetical protein CEXT_370651 [Caerostris extrusa]
MKNWKNTSFQSRFLHKRNDQQHLQIHYLFGDNRYQLIAAQKQIRSSRPPLRPRDGAGKLKLQIGRHGRSIGIVTSGRGKTETCYPIPSPNDSYHQYSTEGREKRNTLGPALACLKQRNGLEFPPHMLVTVSGAVFSLFRSL